jgi:tetratricopeptide (TPR) repeat protein
MDALVGQRLGQYEVVSLLGTGGMARVYRARQTTIVREVALKVINPSEDNRDDFLRRFSREAQLIASMSHPHIGKVFDYGSEAGVFYLVMELLLGGSLAAQLHSGPLPLERISKLTAQVADALDYAHKRGIVHRDLKPQNVLLDENGNAFITDFGLAKSLNTASTAINTQSGTLIGTPAYMSPEQLRGERVDARSDVYSLGVMVFEMLAGQRPFPSDSIHTLLQSHLYESPPAIHEVNPTLSAQINRVVQRALAKQPSARFEAAGDFSKALDKAIRSSVTGMDAITVKVEPLEAIETAETAEITGRSGTTSAASAAPTAPITVPHRRQLLLGAIFIAVIAFVSGAVFVFNRVTSGSLGPATNAPLVVEPVGTNQHMVLVCQLQRSPDVQRQGATAIIEDLRQALEAVPFAMLRIRGYARECASSDEARRVAEANKAAVVVWGNDDGQKLDLNVQVGTLAGFTHNKFPEALIRRVADVRVTVSDPARESVAVQVANIMIALHNADGDGYEVVRNLALVEQVAGNSAVIVGNNPAAQLHRAQIIYLTDTDAYLTQIGEVIALDEANPLLYAYRALAYQRLQRVEASRRDFETARRLAHSADPTWASPLYGMGWNFLFAGDLKGARQTFDDLAIARPNDYMAVGFRGLMAYFDGDLVAGKADLERSIALGPTTNYPYLGATLIALREGRVADVQRYANVVVTEFATPTLTRRILGAAFGDVNTASALFIGPFVAGGTNLLLAQYEQTISDVDQALQSTVKFQVADLHLVRGVALCSLGRYAEAEAAYSEAIKLEPEYGLLYLLRAESNRMQGDLLGAAADAPPALRFSPSDEYLALARAGLEGRVTCRNFFTFQVGE